MISLGASLHMVQLLFFFTQDCTFKHHILQTCLKNTLYFENDFALIKDLRRGSHAQNTHTQSDVCGQACMYEQRWMLACFRERRERHGDEANSWLLLYALLACISNTSLLKQLEP